MFRARAQLFLMSVLLLAVASVARAQLPIAFDPCKPASGSADFRRLCPDQISGPSIIISGASADTHAELLQVFDFASPSDVTSAAIREMGTVLSSTGRYDDISIQPSGNAIRVTLVEKPRVSGLRFSNNNAFSNSELQALANLPIGTTFSRELVVGRSRTILAEYQAKGYFSAAIVPSVAQTSSFAIANGVVVVFELDEGDIAPVSSVRFEGNQKISDARLRSAISSDSAQTADQLTSDRIAADQQAILALYAEEEMERTSVSARIETLDGRGNVVSGGASPASIGLVFVIEERAGFSVGNVSVDGVEGLPTTVEENEGGEVEEELSSGDRFDPRSTQDAAQSLAQQLNEDSEVDLGVRTQIDVNEETGEVDVTFVVFELPPRVLASIRFIGAEQTSIEFMREIVGLEIGDVVSSKDMRDGVQRLANTGLFEDIQISEGAAPTGQVALIITLKEAKTGLERLGASYSSLYGLSLTGGIEERNWLGYGLYAGVAVDLAESRQQIRTFFQNPYFGDDNQLLYAELSVTQQMLDSQDYTQLTTQLSTSLTNQITDSRSSTTSLTLSLNEITDTGPNASALAMAAEGETEISLALAYSLRADTTETNIITRSGYRWDIGASLTGGTSSETYLKYGFGGARYWDFDQEDQRTVLSLRGSADFVAHREGELGLSGRYLDPEVRVRGFALGGIAPRGSNGTAIGGTTALGASLTLTRQFTESENFPLFGSVFLDAGTVFDQGETFALDINGTSTSYDDSGRLRSSAGVGLALATPGGTLSLTYSNPLSSAGFDIVEDVQFNIGTQF